MIPDFVTHYYLNDRKPFLSLSDLSEDRLSEVLGDLREKARRGETKRGFAEWYIPERKRTEEYLRNAFISKGGIPTRKYPLYFVLGKSDTQKSMDPQQLELTLPLQKFPEEKISFTYPDSMASMLLKEDQSFNKPYHGQVFTLKEITEVVHQYGFPKDQAERTSRFLYPCYVEMQLWCDSPILEFL